MNRNKIWKVFGLWLCLMAMAMPASAQKFFNLTSQEVKVDSVLPQFVYSFPLQGAYQDSIYTVEVKYPEYVDMPATDIVNYNRLSGAALLSRWLSTSKLLNAVRRVCWLLLSLLWYSETIVIRFWRASCWT